MADFFQIDPETLAYWYLRLNGFLTITNFVVHPEWAGRQRTDVDVLAARFPHRRELFDMEDDCAVVSSMTRILIYLSEVKTGACNLNGPWTERGKQNMQRVLRAVGAFPLEATDEIADALYEQGFYEDQAVRISLMCVGSQKNPEKRKQFPDVPQITWNHILGFVFKRFNTYRDQKRDHPQWPKKAQGLFKLAVKCGNESEFVRRIVVATETTTAKTADEKARSKKLLTKKSQESLF